MGQGQEPRYIEIPSSPGVHDVFGGLSALPSVAMSLNIHLGRSYDSRKAMAVGDSGHLDLLDDAKSEYCDPDVSPRVLRPVGSVSLASAKDVEAILGTVRQEGVSFVVALFQEDRDEFLGRLISEAPWLAVWCVMQEGPLGTAMRVDGSRLPSIPPIPAAAMYGRAKGLAESLDVPLGYGYLSVLAAACGAGIRASGGIRPALYAGLIGKVGAGKSVSKNRAGRLFFGSRPDSPEEVADDPRWVRTAPGSDRGLLKLLDGANGGPRLLAQDELREMLGKGGIEGSTLASKLCEAFNETQFGTADKKGQERTAAKLSLLGCIKAANPAEFQEVFDYASAHGLYDRMLFGVAHGPWEWRPLDVGRLREVQVEGGFSDEPDFSCPAVGPEVYAAVSAWRKRGGLRARLGELALRVAYVSAAVNKDKAVGEEAIQAALRLMEWQEQIRRFFQPAEGANLHERCVAAIEAAFKALPNREGNWREVARKNHWHRHFASVITGVKKTLETQGILVQDPVSKKHRLFVQEDEQ